MPSRPGVAAEPSSLASIPASARNIRHPVHSVTDPFVAEAEHLTKHYGRLYAVDRSSFNIGRGEFCGILGANGIFKGWKRFDTA